jgi:DNA polymerase I-like protein with 3'-5' exonuclease and polymerase domains
MIIGFFATEDDRKFDSQFRQIVGPHKIMLSTTKIEYVNQVIARVRKFELDALIVTDVEVLPMLLALVPGFKVPRTEKGNPKKLSLNDYHGSLIEIPAEVIGCPKPLEVLFLNPLRHLMTVPEAPMIFKRHISKLTKPDSWFPQTPFTWEICDVDTPAGESRASELLALLDQSVLIAVDTETNRGCPERTIATAQYCFLLADGSSHSFVVPTPSVNALRWMRKFNDTAPPKVMQGGTYDAVYFLRWNAPLRNWIGDTSSLFHSWYAELPKRLDYLTVFALRSVYYWKDDSRAGGTFAFYEYGARDAWATLNAWMSLMLEAPEWATNNYLEQFPNNFWAVHMEVDGLATDKERFDKQREKVDTAIAASLTALQTWISPSFNPRSPVQVKNLLEVFGYRDSRGELADSSDEMTLQLAMASSPFLSRICKEILNYRGLAKQRDTYLQWDKMWHDRLFSRLNVHGTESGRFSSSESSFWCGFNGQNLPQGDDVKSWVRADDGYDLAECDEAQSEARCVGYISGCMALINLVESENDYHSWNASAFFGIPYEEIYDNATGKQLNKPLRNLSKRVNHGSNYNMRAFMLFLTMGPDEVVKAQRLLKLPSSWSAIQVCDHLLMTYARTYPEVKQDWYASIKRSIKLTRKLVSPLGWTRYFFGDMDKSRDAFNSAVAHGPQNLSVQILNRGIRRVWREVLYGKFRNTVRPKLQIHDSLFFAYRGGDHVAEEVRSMMSNAYPVKDIKGVTRTMSIPLDLNCGKKYWSELK